MRRLHLSREWYTTCDKLIDPRPPTPICGEDDGIATVKRGRGEGLVPPRAWSGEFHCLECYIKMLRDKESYYYG